ncbi:MAG: exonuclease subunit SbcD [Bacteroidota bacterium]
MRILHTADWHLGKRLDHFSRLEEQKAVLEEICQIADREQVDAVLIAGDLFDHVNPSIEALELFYKTLKRLAKNGQRAVVGIAGNHDSPDRIEAPVPLARECGIILTGYPDSQVRPFALDKGFEITQSAPGFLEIAFPHLNYPLRLLLTPYANEVRLKRYLGQDQTEASLREVLQKSWGALAKTHCDQAGVNVLMTHLFLVDKKNPLPEEPDDEKPILTVGGAQEIFTENLPKNLHYAALGHLHRHQLVQETPYPVVYSSSPLSYSMSEAGQQKYVVIIEAEPGKAAQLTPIPLTQGRSLERQTFEVVDEAVQWLEANPHTWVELTMVTEDFLRADERKRLYQAHDGIVSLIPQITNPEQAAVSGEQVDLSKDVKSLFEDYFKYKHGQAPGDHILALLKEVMAEEE